MTPLLEVEGLSVHFPIRGGVLQRPVGWVYAVNDVSFSLRAGETLGIVGESGCGKTTLGRALVRLYEPTAGSVRFDGRDISGLSDHQLKQLRADVQMVFQDPYTSLNPRRTIERTLEEPLLLHGVRSKQERRQRVRRLVDTVGLRESDLPKYPHEFSGGQRQRIGIARALVLEPRLVIADEPVSALDVSIQSQVLNLLVELQREHDLTYLFISHDLTVVKYISDRVAVMYLGRIMEIADSEAIYRHPRHPYTQALLAAVPVPDPNRARPRVPVEGDVPNPSAPPPGCPFHTRCHFAIPRCREVLPPLVGLADDPGHRVACIRVDEIPALPGAPGRAAPSRPAPENEEDHPS